MARALTAIAAAADDAPPRESGRALADAVADGADGLAQAVTLLKELHEAGVLEFLTALTKRGEDVLRIWADLSARPEYAGGIRSAAVALQGLAAIDSEALATLLSGVAEGTRRMAEERDRNRVAGVMDLYKALKDPDVGLALGSGLAFLRGMGRALREAGGEAGRAP